jgi:general secretion pathway protein E
MEKKDANVLKEQARRNGMRTLREDGWLKVKEGITTVSEVVRVTQEEQIL